MGKKSRLKRERRIAKQKLNNAGRSNDVDFVRSCSKLRDLFSQYSSEDVIASLCVSDLWLPNISSQVKHALAYAVFIAMSPDCFKGDAKIESYSEFKRFAEQAYAILPTFPMLEDYFPESDWGEIKFYSGDSLLQVFGGGAVGLISDFTTAFHLIYGPESQAVKDMSIALLAQNHLISKVIKPEVGDVDSQETGHIETPNETFWEACREAVKSLSACPELTGLSGGLIVEMGATQAPKERMEFCAGIVSGSILPAIFIRIGSNLYPLALRNTAAAVLEYWASRGCGAPPAPIADFLYARFRDVIRGPFQVVSHNQRLPFIFAAALSDGTKPHLVAILEEADLAQLPTLEIKLKEVVDSGDWALQPIGSAGAIQLRNSDGAPPAFDQLVVVAAIASISAAPATLVALETNVRVLHLPEFVTLFDSIEDVNELVNYWKFVEENSSAMDCGFSNLVDHFAAFRDSHGLLVDGALNPTLMMLDPHWGDSWRHRTLASYWDNAPPMLPSTLNTAWDVKRHADGLYALYAKRIPAECWSAIVGRCVTHFILVVREQPIQLEDGQLLELLIKCLADSLNQRMETLMDLPLFQCRQITTLCRVQMDSLVSQDNHGSADAPLFSNWEASVDSNKHTIEVVVQVNLQRIRKDLEEAVDSSFEVVAVADWVEGLSASAGIPLDSSELEDLRKTSGRSLRFTLNFIPRNIDVPDIAIPSVPASSHFKRARRDLARVFRDQGAKEGRYELKEAKGLIDSARDAFRSQIHSRISVLRRSELVRFCIEQLDRLTAEFDRQLMQIQISLTHEVDYDRTKTLAEANKKFVSQAKNYRYLLECRLSMPESGSDAVRQGEVMSLLASIDWLAVLYSASDVLHNGLDVAGLQLDHSFVPQVFYTSINESRQTEFANESADMKLGLGLNKRDEVQLVTSSDEEWIRLNHAFEKDIGVGLDKFLACLHILTRWPSFTEVKDLQFSYSAPRNRVRDILVAHVIDITPDQAERVVSFLCLNPLRVRRLIGKSSDESDVPVWEHSKRGDRYTIRPLVHNAEGVLTWGAATVERASRIWEQSLVNGYLPADFDWPNIKVAVRAIKICLEKGLESVSAEVLSRATPHVLEGVDFMHRFPKHGFDDVGDFDGLAYWPESNQWIAAECKYNKPAFCLKDARRLRDDIFGTSSRRGQFSKIERRRTFLKENMETILSLLGWPLPPEDLQATVHELYISRDIYWWMRNPPYSVPTCFVRIDALTDWLQDHELLSS